MAKGTGLLEWLTLFAIIIGPLLGIWVTRWIDSAKERKDRRWELFVTLRRTKGLELSPDHVAAINMVPVLFPEDAEAMGEWETLMDALNNPAWQSGDEMVLNSIIQSAADARHNLIRRIGEVVGAKLPKKEQHRLGYAPVAWSQELGEQAEVRRRLIEVLCGRVPIQMITGIYQTDTQVPAGSTESSSAQIEGKEAGHQTS